MGKRRVKFRHPPKTQPNTILPALAIGLACAVVLAVFAIMTLVSAAVSATPIPILFLIGGVLGLIVYWLTD